MGRYSPFVLCVKARRATTCPHVAKWEAFQARLLIVSPQRLASVSSLAMDKPRNMGCETDDLAKQFEGARNDRCW